jgi:molybdopterin biosynthesis enzyme
VTGEDDKNIFYIPGDTVSAVQVCIQNRVPGLRKYGTQEEVNPSIQPRLERGVTKVLECRRTLYNPVLRPSRRKKEKDNMFKNPNGE